MARFEIYETKRAKDESLLRRVVRRGFLIAKRCKGCNKEIRGSAGHPRS